MPAAGAGPGRWGGGAGAPDHNRVCPRFFSVATLCLGGQVMETVCLPQTLAPGLLPSAFPPVLRRLPQPGHSLEGLFCGKVETEAARLPLWGLL